MINGIFLGAGHSNYQPGAVYAGYTEQSIVTDYRDKLCSLLRARAVFVIADGRNGENFSLSTSIKLANSVDGPRIEFHVNAGAPAATGVEAFSLPKNRRLAQDLTSVVASSLGLTKRGRNGWKSDTEGAHSRLGFCRDAGGVVLELFFLSNPYDLDKYLAHKGKLLLSMADFLSVYKPV